MATGNLHPRRRAKSGSAVFVSWVGMPVVGGQRGQNNRSRVVHQFDINIVKLGHRSGEFALADKIGQMRTAFSIPEISSNSVRSFWGLS